MYAKFYPNIPYGSKVKGNFNFFTIWTSAKPRPMENGILQSLGLDLVNINVYGKFRFIKIFRKAQDIGSVSLFQNLDLGRASTEDLAIPCQYQYIAKFYQNIPRGSRVMGPVSLFQNLGLGKASTDDKWHLVNLWGRTCQY